MQKKIPTGYSSTHMKQTMDQYILKISLYFVRQRIEDRSYSAGVKIVKGTFSIVL